MRVVSKYEAACPVCNVSYPVGQKRCVHCGGRVEKKYVDVADAPPAIADGIGHVEPEPEPAMAFGGEGREIVFLPREATADETEEMRGGWVRRLGGMVWIILFVILTAIRMCSEGNE